MEKKFNIELTKREINWIYIALNSYYIENRKVINNVSKNKKMQLKEKQDFIKGLLDDEGEVLKIRNFFAKF